jgi:transposase
MSRERKQYSPEYKFRMALEAAKNGTTVSQVASERGVHPTQISEWKGTLMTEGASLIERRPATKGQPATKTESELYEQIGRLKMELEWLKKKSYRVQLRGSGLWLNRHTRRSVYGGSVHCWD